MDLNATRRVMQRLAEAAPGWLNWRAETLEQQAEFASVPATEAARRMTELWQRNLADVQEQHALAAVDRLAIGEARLPPFGELPQHIRAEARRLAEATAPRPALAYAAEGPRFRCLDCRDTGWVEVLNPAFVRRFRREFADMADADFTDNELGSWWRRAKLWWRSQGGQDPLAATVVCNCAAGARKPEQLPRRNPQTQPLAGPSLDRRRTLERWYAEEHDVVFWDQPEEAQL